MMFLRSLCLCLALITSIAHADSIAWPKGAKGAVSLSYDDTLNSQLDNVVPTLNRYGIKASFYLILSSPVLNDRMSEWRAVAAAGHELGNHTIYHPCSASQPNREWVLPHNDLDQRTVEAMRQEITTANIFLKALDGRSERTMTLPCGDTRARDGNFVLPIKDQFISIKGAEDLPAGFSSYLVPSGVSGKDLIAFVERATRNGGVANIIFHGVGGDHLSTASADHEQLVKFLAERKQLYWTDTYLNIMKHVRAQLPRP